MKTIIDYLGNCERGTCLYSPIIGYVYLNNIIDNTIYVDTEYGDRFMFDEYGRLNGNGECLLFPGMHDREWPVDIKFIRFEDIIYLNESLKEEHEKIKKSKML